MPLASLTLQASTFYGTTYLGGASSNGTVFAINSDGTGFKTLHSFSAFGGGYTNHDGANPTASLLLWGNTFYGTASAGGAFGNGTVFSLSLPVPPLLTLVPYGTDVILTWPTNAPGFTLQSTTNFFSPAFWTPVSPDPIIFGSQNVVISPLSGAQQFFRLVR